MTNLVTSLIPTSKILEFDTVLQGHLSAEDIRIAVGSGLQNNFNPQSILQEHREVSIEIESVLFKKKNFSLLFTIKIKPLNFKPKEIGLFFLADGQETLIAYRSDENLINFDDEFKAVLELVLPYSPWNQQLDDISSTTNFSPDLYTETPDVEDISSFFSDDLPLLHSPVTDQKLNFTWSDVTKNEVNKFSHELKLIALEHHPKNNHLLFLYKKKDTQEFFFNTYNIKKQEFKKPPSLAMTMNQKSIFGKIISTVNVLGTESSLSDRYGIFGKIDDDYIRAYQAHDTGVSCIGLSVNKSKKSYSKQQYHAAQVKPTSTLYKLGNNAGLGGGDIIGFAGGLIGGRLTGGNAMSASGLLKEALQCLQPSTSIDNGTDNPIITFDDDDDDDIDVIGGNRDKDEITEEIIDEIITETKETKEEETKEIIETKVITEEETKETKEAKEEETKEITDTTETDEEITEEIIEEEIIEEVTKETREITEEETTKVASGPQAQKYIIIKKGGTQKKVAIKHSPIQKISVNGKIVKEENFGYFSYLEPKSLTSEVFTYESASDFNDLFHVNALTHMHCRTEDKVFIFSRKMFKDENEAKFFVYDRANKSITTYFLPKEMRNLVINSNMVNYSDAHAVARDKTIYFSLHAYSKANKKLSTQIIKLEIV